MLVELLVALSDQNDVLLLALQVTFVFLLEPHGVPFRLGLFSVLLEIVGVAVFLLLEEGVECERDLLICLLVTNQVVESLLREQKQPFDQVLVCYVVERL